MREILFRGLHNGTWVYGDLSLRNTLDKPLIYADSNNEYAVKPETIGQFTELTDENGKKIFEGDIVTGRFDGETITGHIVYGSDATFFIERKGLYGIWLNNAEVWLEVIGNIHDNSELLKEAL